MIPIISIACDYVARIFLKQNLCNICESLNNSDIKKSCNFFSQKKTIYPLIEMQMQNHLSPEIVCIFCNYKKSPSRVINYLNPKFTREFLAFLMLHGFGKIACNCLESLHNKHIFQAPHTLICCISIFKSLKSLNQMLDSVASYVANLASSWRYVAFEKLSS